MLRVAFIIESETSAAARYRVLVNVEAFEREGVDVYPMLLPRTLRSRMKLFKDACAYDLVVLQRRLIQPWELYFLRRRVRLLGYDFDDALPYRDHRRVAGFHSLTRSVKFRAITRAADFVTAGNEYLAGLCPAGLERTFVVPTPVDTETYVPADGAGGPVRVGWVGSASTLKYLEEVIPAIERAYAARPVFELAVLADRFPRRRPPFMLALEWREQTEAAEVARFDIGLMPLPDNPWTRGKCGFKLLLYGACAAASVASPVGANVDIIDPGRTGLFASTPAEWERALLELIDDSVRRRAMGQAARERVVARYSGAAIVPRWAAILKEQAAGG